MKHSREVSGNSGLGKNNSNYGYRKSKLYPNEELRNRLVELGIPRYRHDLAELGEMLPQNYISKKVTQPSDFKWVTCEMTVTNTWGDDMSHQDLWERFYTDTEANARAEMLIYLLENKPKRPCPLKSQ